MVIIILLNERFEGVLCNLMLSALRIVENWCGENTLSVNPDKVGLVLFIQKVREVTVAS